VKATDHKRYLGRTVANQASAKVSFRQSKQGPYTNQIYLPPPPPLKNLPGLAQVKAIHMPRVSSFFIWGSIFGTCVDHIRYAIAMDQPNFTQTNFIRSTFGQKNSQRKMLAGKPRVVIKFYNVPSLENSYSTEFLTETYLTTYNKQEVEKFYVSIEIQLPHL